MRGETTYFIQQLEINILVVTNQLLHMEFYDFISEKFFVFKRTEYLKWKKMQRINNGDISKRIELIQWDAIRSEQNLQRCRHGQL